MNKVAQTCRGAEIFTDHRTDHCKSNGCVQAGEHPGQRGGQIDIAQQLTFIHAEHARVRQDGLVHFLDALIDIEEHDEEYQRHAKRDLRPDAKA